MMSFESVADPELSRSVEGEGGVETPTEPIIMAQFPTKTAWNWTKMDPGR